MQHDSDPADLPQTQMRKFNPGLFQSDEEVAKQFVVRQNEFRLVCEVVRSNIESPSCQHTLVVASRGQGKTMLLRRVAAELRMDSELSQHFLPVQFMEESQEVDSLADFWMETLFQLARELASENKDLSEELAATHRSLASRWRDQGFEEFARSAVLDATDLIGRRLVLMVENVQTLFSDADEEFGWGLRAVLQTMPQITLIASATSRFDVLDDPQAPFFELFRFIDLKPLNAEDCGRLWSVVSEMKSAYHENRPLEILTGGNPRLILVVATFARHRSFRRLMEELVVLVDEHTEYFRSQLDNLPKQERRVFVSLIDLWQPSSTSEIAARARLDVRVVSTMLRRLIDRGSVMVVEDDGARNRHYTAFERLYSIYYKLRRETDETAVVESLIRFMVSFYDVGDVHVMSKQLFEDALESTTIKAGIENALAKRDRFDGVDLHLKWNEIAQTYEKINDEVRFNARRLLGEEILKAHDEHNWRELLELTERYISDGFLLHPMSSNGDLHRELIASLRSDAFLRLAEFSQVVNIGEEVEKRLAGATDLTLRLGFGHIKFNQALAHSRLNEFSLVKQECEKIVKKLTGFDNAEVDWRVAITYLLQAEAEAKLGDTSASIALLDETVTKYGDSDDKRLHRPVALALYRIGERIGSTRSDFTGSIRRLDEFIKRYDGTDDVQIRNNLFSAKMKQAVNYGILGHFDQEIAHFESVIDSVNEHETQVVKSCFYLALLQKSRRLAELDRPGEALEICDQAQRWVAANVDLPPKATRQGIDWYANCTRALALLKLGHTARALSVFETAYDAIDLERNSDLAEIMRLVAELIAAGAREEDLSSVLQSDERNAWDLLPLIISLRHRKGIAVKAPVEAVEVAADLEKCIEHRLKHGVQPGYFLNFADKLAPET